MSSTIRRSLVAICWLLGIVTAMSQDSETPPDIEIVRLATGAVEVRWPVDANTFELEVTQQLGEPASWRPVQSPPVLLDGWNRFAINPGNDVQFYRLNQVELTRVISASPADAETGVSVTRETIVYFNKPLSASTVLTGDHFFAGISGRRMLTRVELSIDRTRATLFYLSPLPGSSRITVVFDGTGLRDADERLLDADGDGQPGGAAVISFETLSLTPVTGTSVQGRVFASQLVPGPDTGINAIIKPLGGVTITVDGMEQTIRAVTDAEGNFTLNNTPAGRFFVHIDGRTVSDLDAGIHYPDKAYFPTVGKAWDAVAGRTDNKAGGTGEVYLPLIQAGTLQTVSAVDDTTISFPSELLRQNPALEGVSITVRANSLFNDNGTRGGKVGIAAVPPNRLPGPLPPGIEPAIVITVQTDGGLNFDKPASICFPNLPDPVLKAPLPPGSKQALASFNHDKGIWEPVGSMTVSADGKFICSDEGSGILQPGWHVAVPIPLIPPPCHELCCDGGAGGGGDGFANQSSGPEHRLQISPAGPFDPTSPPPKCKSKPCKNKYATCIRKCDLEYSACSAYAESVQDECHAEVRRKYKCEGTADDEPTCNSRLGTCDALYYRLILKCRAAKERCYTNCFDTCAKGTRFAAKSSLAEDLIASQITALSDELAALMQPYRVNGTEMSAEVRQRIFQLLDEMDRVAGGDAHAFLREYAILQEEAFAPLEEEFGEDPGNAPPYPVMYAAQISRPSGPLILRGETGPFGQYSLFVPRDGELRYVSFYDPRTRRFGMVTPRLRPDAAHPMPRFTLASFDESFPDLDRDGLADAVEFVYGTDTSKPDSDGDGIFDGTEVEQGSNPLDGLPVWTGIVASLPTVGNTVDVWAAEGLMATVDARGVSLFSTAKALNPVLIAHVPTTGFSPRRITGSGKYLAVAGGESGLMIIDVSTPAEAQILSHHRFGNVTAVAARAGIAYIGQETGTLKSVQMATGRVLSQLLPPGPIRDLSVAGDYLYAITEDRVLVLSLKEEDLAITDSTSANTGQGYQRMFASRSTLWSVHPFGYDTYDLADPAQPKRVQAGSSSFFGWSQLAPNGSWLGPAVVQNGLSLYDLSQPNNNDLFVTKFPTPGRIFSVALLDGLAFAGGEGALFVINYLAYDSKSAAPTLTLDTNATGGVADTGRLFRASADAVDDVQVRSVEFYIDGERAMRDGNFPFEYRFYPPAPTATKTQFKLRARAFDTGGNSTWSEELTIKLGPDATPPSIVASAPLGGARIITSVSVEFSEPMNPTTLNPATFKTFSAGVDGLFDTADDSFVEGAMVSYQSESKSALLSFTEPLPDGLYRAVITTAAQDRGGNGLSRDHVWHFRVADAVFWSSNTDGFWDDASNWSTGTVPGPSDTVYLESLHADTTVTHAGGTSAIRKLIVSGRLLLSDGELQVSETIQLHEPMHLAGGTLKGGIIQENGDAKLVFASRRTSTLDAVRLDGDLDLTGPLMNVLIRNGLMLNGAVAISNGSTITFVGNQTFDKSQIVFGDSGQVLIEPGTTLTLGPSMVVRGKTGAIGSSRFGATKLINQGLITSDVAGGTITLRPTQFENQSSMECKNGGSITLLEGESRNNGVINLSGGGSLTLMGYWKNSGVINLGDAVINLGGSFQLTDLGTINRTGGRVNLTGLIDLAGGTLALNTATGPWHMRDGTIQGGTVTQDTNAKLMFPSGMTGTLDGVHVGGDLELLDANSHARIRNGLTLTGNVLVSGNSSINFIGNQFFNNSQILFRESGQLLIEPGTTLILGPTTVIRGKSASITSSFFGATKLINEGLIAADVAGGTILVSTSQFDNQGVIECRNGGSVNVFQGASRNTGVILVTGGSSLQLNGEWSNQGTIELHDSTLSLGGTFKLTDVGTVHRTGGTLILTGVLDLAGETLTLNPATGPWRMSGGTFKGGTILQGTDTKLTFVNNATATLDDVNVAGDIEFSANNSLLKIKNGLRLLTGNLRVINNGTIQFAGTQTINSGQIVFVESGSMILDVGTTLTLGPEMVVRGKSGNIGGGNFGLRKLINQGLIVADVPGGRLSIFPTEFENAGILRADGSSATIAINVNPFTNTGTIQEINGGRVLIAP